MQHLPEALLFLFGVSFAVLLAFKPFSKLALKITIWEFENALLYKDGKLEKILTAGSHWICPLWHTVTRVDIRLKSLAIGGQELLSQDNVGIKLSLAANYKVVDSNLAINLVDNFNLALYTVLQLNLREIVGGLKIDDLLAKRNDIGPELLTLCKPKAAELGLELVYVNIKDIMLSGDYKKVFGQLVKAQKEGQVALEKARGETAALRSLANAAKMLESNPMLLQLRAIQSMSESTGNTLVLNIGHDLQALPLKASSKTATHTDSDAESV